MRLRAVTAALVVSIGAATIPLLASQATPAASPSPFTVRATCTGEGNDAMLHVQFANQGQGDTAVVVGKKVSNGDTFVDSLIAITTRLATGADEDFLYVNPKYALFTGRADPWIVSLPAGGTREIVVAVRDFISRMSYTPLEWTAMGTARLAFEARPLPAGGAAAAKATRVWTGRVQVVTEACQ